MARPFLIRALVAATLLALLPPSGIRAQDIPEMSPQAAAAFADGMAKYNRSEYRAAAEAFARAYELDPSFAVAAFYEGVNWGNAGEADLARAAYARAEAGRGRMSPYYQARLDAQTAGLQGRRGEYMEGNRRAASIAPESKASYNVAQGAVAVRRPHEALQALARLDPDGPPMKGWSGFWTVRHNAQHQAGLYEEELASAREARRRFPELVTVRYDEAEALVALGRTGELDAVIEAFEPLDAPFGTFLVSIAAEADAHGQPATRDRLLDHAIQWFDALPADQASSNGARNWRGLAHYARGEYAEAEALFRALSDGNPDNDFWRSRLGAIAAELGDRDAAEAEIRRLQNAAEEGNRSVRLLYAAEVAAVLGQGERFGDLIRQSLDAGLAFSIWNHRLPTLRRIRDHGTYKMFTSPMG